MAKLENGTVLDITNKLGLGVGSTASLRNYFEETQPWFPQVEAKDVFAEDVLYAVDTTAADANVVATPTIIQKITTYQMDMIPASNNEGFACYATPGDTNSAVLRNFLVGAKFGAGYTFALEDATATPIALTDGQYQFSPSNGILRFDTVATPVILGYTLPLRLTAYRYIGDMVSDLLGTGGSSTDYWRMPVAIVCTDLYADIATIIGTSATDFFEGYDVVDGDAILFNNITAVSEDNRVYTATVVGGNITALTLRIDTTISTDGSPTDGEVLITIQSTDTTTEGTRWSYNGTEWVVTATGTFNLTVGETDGDPVGANISNIYIGTDPNPNVFIDGITAYHHVPAPPDVMEDALSTTATFFTGRMSQSNVNYPPALAAGDSINYIVNTANATMTINHDTNSFRFADVGNLYTRLNAVSVANGDLAANFNEANRSGVQAIGVDYINTGSGDPMAAGDVTFVGGAAGFGSMAINAIGWTASIPVSIYQKGTAQINITSAAFWRQGYNAIMFRHNDGTTDHNSNDLSVFFDTDTGADPAATGDLVIGTPVLKYLSGISYYDIGTTFNLSGTVTDGFDNVYHISNAPVVLSGFPGVAPAGLVYTDTSVTGVSTPPDINETMTITNFGFTLPMSQEGNDIQVDMLPRDPYGDYVTFTTPVHNFTYNSFAANSTALIESFRDENYRYPLTTDFDLVPVGLTGNWNSASTLVATGGLQVYEEDQVTKNCLYHPQFDYSAGRSPISLDYTGMATETDNAYVRVFQGTIDNSNGILRVSGISDADLVGPTPNVSIDIKVPSKTVWTSLNVDYNLGVYNTLSVYPADWAATTAYALGDRIKQTGLTNETIRYVCTTAGTSGGTEPAVWDTTPGNTTNDGTVVWEAELMDGVGCRINTGSHSPNIDGTVEFSLGVNASDVSVNRCIFVRIRYANNAIPRVITGSPTFTITNW